MPESLERRERRVLHVSQPTDAGVARCVATLCADQVERGWTCVVACPGSSPLASAVRAVGGQHAGWRADRSPSARMAAELAALRRIVAAFDPHVVHLHSSKAGLVGRLAIRGRRPTVFQPHAWSFHGAAGRAAAAALAWERVAARWADVIVCVSDGERREGAAHGIRADLRLVENGVDLRRYVPVAESEREAIRRELGFTAGAKVAVTPGRLCVQKGQDVLIDVWRDVRTRRPDAVLVLVGDGPLRPALERAADPSVRLVGNRPDVDRWIAAADLVVLPSRWEGLSLSMLEAMAVARSVVSTRVAGSEVLGVGAGAIVAVGDRRGLADEIVRRFEDDALARREAAAARRIVETRFDVSRMTGSIADLYAQLLGAHGGAFRREAA